MTAAVTTAPDLRQTLLDALSDAIGTCEAEYGLCADCRRAAIGHCIDHQDEYVRAAEWLEAAALLREAATSPAALASILAALGTEGERS